jgi:hypothetical protein
LAVFLWAHYFLWGHLAHQAITLGPFSGDVFMNTVIVQHAHPKSIAGQYVLQRNFEKVDSLSAQQSGAAPKGAAGHAAMDAVLTLLADWRMAVRSGTSLADLLAQVDEVTNHVQEFKQAAAREFGINLEPPALEQVTPQLLGSYYDIKDHADKVYLHADTVTICVERAEEGIEVKLQAFGSPFEPLAATHLSFAAVEAATCRSYGADIDDVAVWAQHELGVTFAGKSVAERLKLIRKYGASHPANRGFHRIPDAAVESHFLSGAFFVTEAAQAEVMKHGLDKVLSWFNRPRKSVKVGDALPMDEMPLQAFFGFDSAQSIPESFYVAISLLKPEEISTVV